MRRLILTLRLVPLLALTAGAPLGCGDGGTGPNGCCKVCREGKACGDTCISRSDTCHKGAGCACDG